MKRLLALLFLACGPVAPGPDTDAGTTSSTTIALPPTSSTSLDEPTTPSETSAGNETGGSTTTVSTSTGTTDATTSTSTSTSTTGDEDCEPWKCALGCPGAAACDADGFCRIPGAPEPLCGPETCDHPCDDDVDCNGAAAGECILGLCVPPTGAPFCPACVPLLCGDGCPAAATCTAIGQLEVCVDPLTMMVICRS